MGTHRPPPSPLHTQTAFQTDDDDDDDAAADGDDDDDAGGADADHDEQDHEPSFLLRPPLPLVGVSMGRERGCQQNNSTGVLFMVVLILVMVTSTAQLWMLTGPRPVFKAVNVTAYSCNPC